MPNRQAPLAIRSNAVRGTGRYLIALGPPMTKRMAMARVWWLALLLTAGCLEGGGAVPPGREILPGREPRRPSLVRAGADADELFVVYETLKTDSEADVQSPRLWAVPYEGGQT